MPIPPPRGDRGVRRGRHTLLPPCGGRGNAWRVGEAVLRPVADGEPPLAAAKLGQVGIRTGVDERVRSRDRHDGERGHWRHVRKPVADAGCEARVKPPTCSARRSRRRVAQRRGRSARIGRSSASVPAGPSPSILTAVFQGSIPATTRVRRAKRWRPERSSHDAGRQRSIHERRFRGGVSPARAAEDRVAGERCPWTIPTRQKVRAAPCRSPRRGIVAPRAATKCCVDSTCAAIHRALLKR